MQKNNINIRCRNCQSKNNFKNLFSLGKLSFTGKFPKQKKINIPKAEIRLVICSKCKLVQVSKNYNLKYMYDHDYGYRTGINSTMTLHVKDIVNEISKKINLKKDDIVLDIASNDATLLNFYNKKLIRVGIDPLIKKYKDYYKKINHSFSNFFAKKLLPNYILQKKIKSITALSVFYDLEDPNSFLKDISEIIDKNNGIFILEHTDLLSIIKKNLFDTICHEHLTYYSAEVLMSMINNNNLRVFDMKRNSINGGSLRFYICHKKAVYKINKSRVKHILKDEKLYALSKKQTYKDFFNRINSLKKELIHFLMKIKKNGKVVHGYGASTKGNVLLQYFKIDNKIIPYIADRNKLKVGSYSPGLKIPIISENNSYRMKPDYYLVLPWHFKDFFLSQSKYKGFNLIFPLPKLEIIKI